MKRKILLTLFILSLIAITFYSLKGMLTPYVPLKMVTSTRERIQVLGMIDYNKPVTQERNKLTFFIKDNSNISLPVIFKGQQPANFKTAKQVVLIGKYKSNEKIFYTEKILTKCPSKYEKTN